MRANLHHASLLFEAVGGKVFDLSVWARKWLVRPLFFDHRGALLLVKSSYVF